MREKDKHSLLREIVSRRKPELVPLVDGIGSEPLTDDEREELRGVVSDEFVETGLDASDEPTSHGLVLESVIDWLGSK